MTYTPLCYPKIPDSQSAPLKRCIAFEKCDGTNLHWVWDPELGWYEFGMRRSRFDLDDTGKRDFDANHPGYEDAPEIFRETLAGPLETVFREVPGYGCSEVTVFTEYFGASSFAGLHKAGEPKQLVLFDVQIESGIIGPGQFVADFGHLNTPRILYRGKLTGRFADDVREGRFNVTEGVVCKGGNGGTDLWMVKIKTNRYMERLKQAFANEWEKYWE